jgi:hypothetical protein
MYGKAQKLVAMFAVLCAIAVGSAVVANAASNGSSGSSGATGATGSVTAAPSAQQPQGPPPTRPDETLLTGDTAAKVKAAAEAKVPNGTVERVETDSDGSPYEAHMQKADETQIVVKVDKSFDVTAVEDMPAHP